MDSPLPTSESPAADQSLRQQLRLALVSGVGPLAQRQLLERFGTAEEVLAAAANELQLVSGIGPKIASRIVRANNEIDVDAQLKIARQHDIKILWEAHDDYPPLLKELPDPPGVLFLHGTLRETDRLAVAIVGTRHATRYGLEQAKRLAGGLARCGITVVSGLARGIDTAAHRGALEAGGRTIAVLASGVLEIYPPENRELAERVRKQGCLVSEAAPTMPPISGMFPQRNRIISGMTLGTIVVEAPDRSGALITARHAWEQNREVFAVPGPVNSRVSSGPNGLIRDGAKLVATVEDVLEELGPLADQIEREDGSTVRSVAEITLNEVEQRVLQAVETSGSLVDDVTQTCGLPVHRVLATVHVLEMRGLLRRVGGNRICRV